jgi:NADH pyrophosphatase NudC (nudix superfamily)
VISILRHKAVTQTLQPRLRRKKLQYIIALLYIAPLFVNFQKFLSQQFQASSELCSNKWEDNIYFFIYGWILNIGETLAGLYDVSNCALCEDVLLIGSSSEKSQEIIFHTNNKYIGRCGEKSNHKSSTFAN